MGPCNAHAGGMMFYLGFICIYVYCMYIVCSISMYIVCLLYVACDCALACMYMYVDCV